MSSATVPNEDADAQLLSMLPQVPLKLRRPAPAHYCCAEAWPPRNDEVDTSIHVALSGRAVCWMAEDDERLVERVERGRLLVLLDGSQRCGLTEGENSIGRDKTWSTNVSKRCEGSERGKSTLRFESTAQLAQYPAFLAVLMRAAASSR